MSACSYLSIYPALRRSLEYRLLNRLVVEEISGRFPACLPACLPTCLTSARISRISTTQSPCYRGDIRMIPCLSAYLPAYLSILSLRGSLEYRLLNRLVVEEIFGWFPACLSTLSLRRDISIISHLLYLLPICISREIFIWFVINSDQEEIYSKSLLTIQYY